MARSNAGFNLSSVFGEVARTIPDHPFLTWRGRRLTYADVDARADGVAHYLTSAGPGCHTERDGLQGHESGQDHLGIYLRNGNEYPETLIGSYRARVAPFNVNYRYVDEELRYLLNDAKARALVYHAEFAPHVAALRDKLPDLDVLIQVADDSGNQLVPGAVDYESITSTPCAAAGMPEPSPDDLYILYTGGTTGMPKGVLWRQHDIFVSAMGGRPFNGGAPFPSYEAVAEQAKNAAGVMSLLVIPPFMHGAAQWAAFHAMTIGGRLVLADDPERLRPDAVLRLAEREKVTVISMIGDAVARPLLDEIETGRYDLSATTVLTNGGATLSPAVQARLLAALPHATINDAVGSSESGYQMNTLATTMWRSEAATFNPQSDTAVIASDYSRVLKPGDGEGWLARRDYIPLGYLNDADKTARTFPTVDGIRWSVPGDRARILVDGGRIELLGRDSVTVNSGGEKIFVEEVERAIAAHPDVYDVVVVGRPSPRWGNEVVAIVQPAEGRSPSDDELVDVCRQHVARYKVPKAFIRTAKVVRSPAGKADYRWARDVAANEPSREEQKA